MISIPSSKSNTGPNHPNSERTVGSLRLSKTPSIGNHPDLREDLIPVGRECDRKVTFSAPQYLDDIV